MTVDILAVSRQLADRIGATADENDRLGRFPVENYDAIRDAGYTSLALPVEFGGWGASVADTARSLRMLAQGEGATALGMIQHHLTMLVLGDLAARGLWDGAAFLREVANRTLIVGMYGSLSEFTDRVPRTARKVDGGWILNGRLGWGTMSPAADYGTITANSDDGLLVCGIYDVRSPAVEPQNDWDTLGMRASGSQDIVFRDLFMPDTLVYAIRPNALRMEPVDSNPLFVSFSYGQLLMVALYLGLAEAARRLTIETLTTRSAPGSPVPLGANPGTQLLFGEIDLIYRAADMVLMGMIDRYPTPAGWNAIGHLDAAAAKDFVAQSCVQIVERCFQLLGGMALYRRAGIERFYRDVRSATIHPLNHLATIELLGKAALAAQPAAIEATPSRQ